MLVNVLRWCHIVTRNHKALVTLLTIRSVSLFLSLGYDSLFPCLYIWVSFQSCVQTKLAFHYVSSNVPYFPFVSSHLSSCFSSASQCKLSVMISSSCRHHDSLTILIHFISPYLALWWLVVFLFSQSLVLWLCSLVFFCFPTPVRQLFAPVDFHGNYGKKLAPRIGLNFK